MAALGASDTVMSQDYEQWRVQDVWADDEKQEESDDQVSSEAFEQSEILVCTRIGAMQAVVT